MKKLLAAVLLALCFTLPLLAQESEKTKPIWDHGDNVSELTINYVRIYKILDQKDAYVILYEKSSGYKAGRTVVPKKWYNERPCKLEFSNLAKGLSPYMTVIRRNGTFEKVIICVPPSRRESVWGVVKPWESLPITNEDELVF